MALIVIFIVPGWVVLKQALLCGGVGDWLSVRALIADLAYADASAKQALSAARCV